MSLKEYGERLTNMPILSICIATYNRANYIGETLNSIIPQLDDDVELLIVDGASTDNTEGVVREFIKKEPRIHYVRLPAKGGVDQDYDKAVELARGEYCWLFTDDDLLKPGALAAVKAAIKNDYDLVIVNAEVRDKKVATIIEPRRMSRRENKIYTPNEMDSFFIDSANYLSFIGSVVIRRALWLGCDRKSYFGTEFIHIGVIFQKILTKSILIIAEPYIIIRWGNAQWAPRGFDIWLFKWPNLIWSLSGVSREAKQVVVSADIKIWTKLKHLLNCRAASDYNLTIYQKYLSIMKTNIVWKFFAWIIAIIPIKIALVLVWFTKPIYRSLKKIIKRHS